MSKSKKTNQIRPAQVYERKESYRPNEVLNFLPNPDEYPKGWNLKKIKKEYDGDMMKMGSQRYYTFAKSLKCCHCDITGNIFYKERSMDKNGRPQEGGFHFNLYGLDKDGNEVLMTKDHIIAKSRGGKDILSNFTTMCKICNEEKGSMDYEEFKKIKQKELQETAKKVMLEKQSIGRSLREKQEPVIINFK